MTRGILSSLVLFGFVAAGCATEPNLPDGPPPPDIEFERHFGDITGTFVLLDGRSGDTLRHNPERAGRRYVPASTFKIPHTLIALESGVVDGPDFPLAWDSTAAPRQRWWPAAWGQDHTLHSAFSHSVVWYYQELARRIGEERMSASIDRFGYGNRDVSGGIDTFWLTGDLSISADEQIDFLRRFYVGELGVSEQTARSAREIMVLEETSSYRFSGKTGWAGVGRGDSPDIGWLVGYIERDGRVSFFAMNIDINQNEDARARLQITRAVLLDAGLIEE